MNELVRVQQLGQQEYSSILHKLKEFTRDRSKDTPDEIWLLEHDPVFTQGQAGKPEHIISPGNIPIVQSDRGGQVTYHGPGQLIVYLLIDLQRKHINIRDFITLIEQSVIELLANYGIKATTKDNAPGVYVEQAKICSLGLRVRNSRTYHGLSLNVDMDLEPFTLINPCGYTDMKMVQVSDLGGPTSVNKLGEQLLAILTSKLGYKGTVRE